jgi:hypothetical protein
MFPPTTSYLAGNRASNYLIYRTFKKNFAGEPLGSLANQRIV